MTITWDAQADAKLLVGIIATSTASIDFPRVAEFMGDGCTVNALKHRIQRIKEKAGLASSNKAGASNSPSGLKTKRATTMKAKKASPKRKPTLPKTSEHDSEKCNTSECEKEIHDEDQLA